MQYLHFEIQRVMIHYPVIFKELKLCLIIGESYSTDLFTQC